MPGMFAAPYVPTERFNDCREFFLPTNCTYGTKTVSIPLPCDYSGMSVYSTILSYGTWFNSAHFFYPSIVLTAQKLFRHFFYPPVVPIEQNTLQRKGQKWREFFTPAIVCV
jgi:hypothetical protein